MATFGKEAQRPTYAEDAHAMALPGPYATSACGLKLLVYAALRSSGRRMQRMRMQGLFKILRLLVHAPLSNQCMRS
jgi:hypothetical protein